LYYDGTTMRRTLNFSLPRDLKEWVDEQVDAGGYATASEYVCNLLRRARARQARRRIDVSLIKTLESRPLTVMDDADLFLLRRAARRRATRSGSKK
jgi:antitoxin ParD1/3/4